MQMRNGQMSRRDLEIAYRTGTVSRGRFKRMALAQGWTIDEVRGFERKHKQKCKQAKRARSKR